MLSIIYSVMDSVSSQIKPAVVLIHGAWHGAWVWRYVRPQLEALGYNVYTPNLPGVNASAALRSQINLTTYVKFIEEFLPSIPSPIILVGHSMAGMIISQVAENMPNKIQQLIYVAAFLPALNGSLVDETSKSSNDIGMYLDIDFTTNIISLKPNPHLRSLFYGHCTEEDYEYATSHLQPQPYQPFIDKVQLTAERFGKVAKLYIECTLDGAINIADQRRMHQRTECRVVTIETDHSPFFSAPGALVSAILKY